MKNFIKELFYLFALIGLLILVLLMKPLFWLLEEEEGEDYQ